MTLDQHCSIGHSLGSTLRKGIATYWRIQAHRAYSLITSITTKICAIKSWNWWEFANVTASITNQKWVTLLHALCLSIFVNDCFLYHMLQVVIRKAYNDLYAAVVDKRIAMKIGPASWAPSQEDSDGGQKEWRMVHSGPNLAVWEAVFWFLRQRWLVAVKFVTKRMLLL